MIAFRPQALPMPNQLSLQSLPLFPLDAVLFPGGLLPLRIFEVRYLDMIKKCHAAKAPFGVVALTAGSEVRTANERPETFHDVGTLAVIEELEVRQPGLIMVRCTGTLRFQISQRERLKHGLWTADVLQVPEDMPVAIPDDLEQHANALSQLIETLEQRSGGRNGPEMPLQPPWRFEDCGWVANRWCELLPLPVEVKQRLMALDNPVVRLELVGDILSRTGIAS
jgi:Lon protease-like protein